MTKLGFKVIYKVRGSSKKSALVCNFFSDNGVQDGGCKLRDGHFALSRQRKLWEEL